MKSVLRLMVTSIATLALITSSVPAQIIPVQVLEEDRPVRVCGEFETVEVDGQIINQLITEDCETVYEAVESTDSTGGGLGIAAGVLLVGGLVAAAGGGGGNDSPSVQPGQPNPPGQPSPLNMSDPAYWRTGEFNRQYGLGLIGVEHRYAMQATGNDTLVAIYDDGIDLNHRDVGLIRKDLSHSYGVDPNDLSDISGHGTNVYGIIGAPRNGIDIHGVALNAEIMILKDSNNELFPVDEFTDALKRAIDAGADVMNNSWGTSSNQSPQQLLLSLGPDGTEQLRRSAENGVSVVFGTGNDSNTESQLWARLPVALSELTGNWLAVTALNNTRNLQSAGLWSGSNRCGVASNWCLAAPGENIMSLSRGGGLDSVSGTSIATAHVTGAILILKGQFPELTTLQVHQILFDTAIDLGDPGIDSVYGHGALNLGESMTSQGALFVELGPKIDQTTSPLSESYLMESAVTGGTLAAALFDQSVLVTDRYDRGYFAALGPRIVVGESQESAGMQTGLSAAFSRVNNSHSDLANAGLDLRFNTFGPSHDVTRIAHMDPVMALVGQTARTGFSMDVPVGKATLSMAQATAADGGALSLGASLPFKEKHNISVSLGRAQETDSILGAKTFGAFAGLNSNTVYGRVKTDIVLGKRVTLNGSVTVGQTSFKSTGLLNRGRVDTRAVSLGVSITDALASGDKLSLALARPLAVSGGQVTLRNGTGISASENGHRTDRISYTETTVPLGAADSAPELHLGYLHSFETRNWASADLAFGGIARLDGGAQMTAARVALTLGF